MGSLHCLSCTSVTDRASPIKHNSVSLLLSSQTNGSSSDKQRGMASVHLYSKQSVSDLVLLSTIDEDSILVALKSRHAGNDIYTYIGNVLLSLNPFKSLNIFGDAYISKYRGRYEYSALLMYSLTSISATCMSILLIFMRSRRIALQLYEVAE
jgi:myosin heavy subunit